MDPAQIFGIGNDFPTIQDNLAKSDVSEPMVISGLTENDPADNLDTTQENLASTQKDSFGNDPADLPTETSQKVAYKLHHEIGFQLDDGSIYWTDIIYLDQGADVSKVLQPFQPFESTVCEPQYTTEPEPEPFEDSFYLDILFQ